MNTNSSIYSTITRKKREKKNSVEYITKNDRNGNEERIVLDDMSESNNNKYQSKNNSTNTTNNNRCKINSGKINSINQFHRTEVLHNKIKKIQIVIQAHSIATTNQIMELNNIPKIIPTINNNNINHISPALEYENNSIIYCSDIRLSRSIEILNKNRQIRTVSNIKNYGKWKQIRKRLIIKTLIQQSKILRKLMK